MRGTNGKDDSAVVEREVFVNELYSRLGLTATAAAQEIEAAYEECVSFLESAPPDLRQWATSRLEDANEAYALLSDPTIDLHEVAAERGRLGSPREVEQAQPVVRPTAPVTTRKGSARFRLPGSRKLWTVALLAGAAVVVFGVYRYGGPNVPAISGDLTNSGNADPAAAASAPAQKPLDRKVVASLMQKIKADPGDDKSLQQLGDAYFQSGDYKVAADLERKVITANPKNTTARLALGASLFNLGDGSGAEKAWIRVTELAPSLAETHYDLGFLYLSKNPPDLVKVKQEWNEVVRLDPNSQIAKTVAAHLKRLDGSDPAPRRS